MASFHERERLDYMLGVVDRMQGRRGIVLPRCTEAYRAGWEYGGRIHAVAVRKAADLYPEVSGDG